MLYFTYSPETMAQRSRLVGSCVCCRFALLPGLNVDTENLPGSLHWFDWFSGHTEPAVSAPLLRSSGCMPPTSLQTSWNNTTQVHWVNMRSSSITYSRQAWRTSWMRAWSLYNSSWWRPPGVLQLLIFHFERVIQRKGDCKSYMWCFMLLEKHI